MALYHIDSDMGVDDGLALLLASRMPNFQILRLSTVFGNVPLEIATRNARLFRYLLGRSFEIVSGAPQSSDGIRRTAAGVHGADGMGGATQMLDRLVLDAAVANPGPCSLASLDTRDPPNQRLTIVGLGPATNIPQIVAWYGRDNVERIVLMSGVFFDRGNVSECAEFNAICDPGALRATLALGLPVTIVPLDVCRKVQLSRATIMSWAERDRSPIMELLVKAHLHYADVYQKDESIDGCFPHDGIAILAAAMPEKFFCVRGCVEVDCGAERRGRTRIVQDHAASVEIVTGGNLKWVRDRFRVLSFDRPGAAREDQGGAADSVCRSPG